MAGPGLEETTDCPAVSEEGVGVPGPCADDVVDNGVGVCAGDGAASDCVVSAGAVSFVVDDTAGESAAGGALGSEVDTACSLDRGDGVLAAPGVAGREEPAAAAVTDADDPNRPVFSSDKPACQTCISVPADTQRPIVIRVRPTHDFPSRYR